MKVAMMGVNNNQNSDDNDDDDDDTDDADVDAAGFSAGDKTHFPLVKCSKQQQLSGRKKIRQEMPRSR